MCHTLCVIHQVFLMPRTTPSDTTGLPKGIPYIIGNEVAERFSFYGMKTILTIFMFQYLWLMDSSPVEQMSELTASKHYHSFSSWVYVTPFLGALLADAFFGKYRVILWLSIVYCIGHACLAFMGVFGDAAIWFAVGLGIICLGAGGIKPCVSAHVGDQFGPNNQNLLTQTFNWFYFSINFGAFTSTLLTPLLLLKYGPHWAFGVPGVLMALATFTFWLGRNKFIHVPAKSDSFFSEVFSPVGLRTLLRLVPLYILVAFFWALFDQTGSSWIFQSIDMDRNIFGIEVLPSQVQAINPVLILILVPLFSLVVYPAINKVIPLTPLRKIGAGLFLTAAAFAIIAVIQISIDGGARPNIGWQLLAYLVITAAEVMVSIVCLEYSYTQAPKTMKSIIMATFFLSVWLGNQMVSVINGFLEVPDPVAGHTETDHPGFDGESGNADDIRLTIKEGRITDREIPGQNTFDEAYALINDWASNNEFRLPNNEEAGVLISGIEDRFGNALTYTQLNSKTARLASAGPDKQEKTSWDIGFILSVPESRDNEENNDGPTWLEKRKQELGIEDEKAPDGPVKLGKKAFTGGQPKLQGASYFWLFTGMMLVASLIFVAYAFIVGRQRPLDGNKEALFDELQK